MGNFTHFDEKGNARMVDVSEKQVTSREAVAEGIIVMSDECLSLIKEGKHKKGDVLTSNGWRRNGCQKDQFTHPNGP